MIRRLPLWLTLVPLVAGALIYWLLWSGWARDFEVVLRPWLPDSDLSITGFPYRMEADVEKPRLVGGDIVKLVASAARAQINRGPWQPELTIISTEAPRFSAIVGPAIGASLSGLNGLTSVHIVDGRLIRLSTRIQAARARLGFTQAAIGMDLLEVHLRETGTAAAADGTAVADGKAVADAGPTQATRGQMIIDAQRLRLDEGDALTVKANIDVTGKARLTNFDAWTNAGTIEVRDLAVADAHGELARISATIVPLGRNGLRFAGTIETICPASMAAAFAGAAPVSEQRLRTAIRIAFEGTAGAVRLAELPADLGQRAVRGQLPPCPAVRGIVPR
jgi:hypothetical protein